MTCQPCDTRWYHAAFYVPWEIIQRRLRFLILEQWIDQITNPSLWTGIQPDVPALSNRTDTPLITLLREPHFGFGSVYTIAAYEDGTVVYTGIANVNETGVHVFQTDASTVTNIASNAHLSGYFNWQDPL